MDEHHMKEYTMHNITLNEELYHAGEDMRSGLAFHTHLLHRAIEGQHRYQKAAVNTSRTRSPRVAGEITEWSSNYHRHNREVGQNNASHGGHTSTYDGIPKYLAVAMTTNIPAYAPGSCA